MSQLLESLLSLQKLDDALVEMERKKEELPARIVAAERELESARSALEANKKALSETQREQRRLEKDLEEGVEQLRKKQARKFEVKTNDEFRAILKEIEFTQQAHSAMEDQILRLIERVESLEKEVARQEKEVEALTHKVRLENKRLEEAVVQVDRDHIKARQERGSLSKLIKEEILRDYETIRRRRSGLAVVVLHSEVCPGCHMAIPFQTLNEVVQTGEIRHCPHCRRILYYEN
ncbi:MAG: C4-type zinc ribbon domain-containing protein [bacterium]